MFLLSAAAFSFSLSELALIFSSGVCATGTGKLRAEVLVAGGMSADAATGANDNIMFANT